MTYRVLAALCMAALGMLGCDDPGECPSAREWKVSSSACVSNQATCTRDTSDGGPNGSAHACVSDSFTMTVDRETGVVIRTYEIADGRVVEERWRIVSSSIEDPILVPLDTDAGQL